jgi:hypothetical protein
MADHFEEVVNLRRSAVEQRFDAEVAPMQQTMNAGIATMVLGFRQVMDRIEGLEQRMDGLETRMDSFDIKLDGVLEIVQDIARRLPPMAQA